MIHIGVDIAKDSHFAAAMDDNCNVVLAPFVVEQSPEGFAAFDKILRGLGPELQIGMEATGHYWLTLYTFLVDQGWSCIVFNPVLTKTTNAARLRGRKTDADDALGIAMTIRDGAFNPYEKTSPILEELQVLCRQREFFASQLRNTKKRLGTLVDCLFPEIRKHFKDPYCKSALRVLAVFPSADCLAQAHLGRLKKLLLAGYGKKGAAEKAESLREGARASVARGQGDMGKGRAAEGMVKHIASIEKSIKEVELFIGELYEKLETPLDSIVGIGPATGAVIVSELGRLKEKGGSTRKQSRRILAFAGLDVRVRDSGKYKSKRKMSKRGSKVLRTALYQAATMARMHSDEFNEIYLRQKARGKSHKVAISHVARKLVEVIVALEKSGQPFDSKIMSGGKI